MKANPDELKSVEVHEEVPKEEATVETFRALKEWYEDRHLAIRCRCQTNKQTQGSGGSWKKLAATCRGMTRHALPAQHKGHCHQGQGNKNVVQGTQ
jgi:exopolyphosphatase/pppGpp-phosphohydrolase